MTYGTVMVSLGLDRSNDARLEIAGQLAKRFDACVIGITAGQFSPPFYFTTGEHAQKLLDEGQTGSETASPKWKRSFARRCRTVLPLLNGAVPRIFRPDSSSGKHALPTLLSSESTVAMRSPIHSWRPIQAIS
jgi:hypothetical protein